MSSSSNGREESEKPDGQLNGVPTQDDGPRPKKDEPTANPKKSLSDRAKQLWAKTGITWPIYRSMFKGALAPTIAIACFQADSYSAIYTTVGYLIGVVTILSVVIQPRAKFLQTMLFNLLFVCFGAAITLLAMYCCVQARGTNRPGTGGPGTSGQAAAGAATAEYNSSASAVAGIWLFVQIYVIAIIRAKKPQFMIPSILWAIFANVGMVYAPQLSTMAQAEQFAKKLIEAFLTGFAIAAGVSLFVFPVNSREVVFKDITGYITSLRSALKANMTYVQSLEEKDMFTFERTNTARQRLVKSPEAQAVKAKMQALAGLNSKFQTDLPFAKREIALGKLGPDDIQNIARLMRMIMIPTLGLSCLSDIFERTAEDEDWEKYVVGKGEVLEGGDAGQQARAQAVQEWHELTKMLRDPFKLVSDMIDEGLEHVLVRLELSSKREKSDAEAAGDQPKPGDDGFAQYMDQRTNRFHDRKIDMLRGWCNLHGIDLPQDFFSSPDQYDHLSLPRWLNQDFDSDLRRRCRRQLYLCLYMEFVLYSISRRTFDLVMFAEELKAHGKLSKKRLIVPGPKRLRKWAKSWFASHDEDTHEQSQMEGNDHTTTVYLGQAFAHKKDPMHLPPQNAWERFGNQLREASRFLGSPESAFGFRVATATMCIAVVAYLRDTQVFYTKQRLFWAQIMVAIGMQPTAGQSLRSSVFRIWGTAMFMVAALLVYYMPDEHVAGVLVFYFVLVHVGPYIILKYPAYTTLGMIGPITVTLIIGYELQVRKIGLQLAESNGQEFYPVYELGPIRLATVVGGLFLGWLWTIFPYPISEHSQQKQSLGSSLYLLANYYSVMHETVRARLRGTEGDVTSKSSPGYKLDKSRRTLFSKCTLLLSGMRARAAFIKFDIPIGGKFPRKLYEKITDELQSTLNFMALVSYASTEFSDMHGKGDLNNDSEWLHSFRKVIGDVNLTSQAITTLLSLMSASVTTGQALPPYLRVPEPYQLSKRIDEMDQDLLSIRHIAEPGYASFAVIQIGTKCIIDDLKKLLADVKELVGELDFSYHVISTADPSKNGSEETLTYAKQQSPGA